VLLDEVSLHPIDIVADHPARRPQYGSNAQQEDH